MEAEAKKLSPGWYAQLAGEKVDLSDWVYTLNEPFDPVAIEEPNGTFVLRSNEFESAETAAEVREKALALIARINGAMALMHSATPVRFAGVIRIDEERNRHTYAFGEMVAVEFGRLVMRSTAVVLGRDGKPLPPPPPQPSAAQVWNRLAAQNDDVADLLEQLGKADGWYEIYKTIEIAEAIVGGRRQLEGILGEARSEFAQMRRTANFYRHARAPRPAVLTALAKAKSLLNFAVRTVLDKTSFPQ